MPKFRAAILFYIATAAPGALLFADGPVASPAPTLSPQAAHDLLHQIDDAYVSVFEKVAPAVVIVEADKKPAADGQDQNFDFYFHPPATGEGAHPQPAEPSVRSEGSGFIVRPDGFIYTNYHVVDDAEKIEVKLRDGRRFAANLVGADEHTDIAVLKIDAARLPVVTMLDSNSVRVGQMCFAIGVPYNLDYSFCRGVVSGKGRGDLASTPANLMYEDYIQTDAFINPGNSGGPLFDIDGRVMGMNTLINGLGRGLSFAIPSNMLNDVGGDLITTGHASHPWLGVQVKALRDQLDDDPSDSDRFHGLEAGVCIETIEANAPAYKSDLRPKDVVISVDGSPVLTAHDLQREILHKKVGQTVNLNVWRSGKTLTVPVVTDALPSDLSQVAQGHSKAKIHPSDATDYGLEFPPVRPGGQAEPVRDKLNAGASVTAVLPDSPAGRAGVRVGDIVTTVDQKPVTDAASCLDLLAAHRGASGPVLTLDRNGQKARALLDTGGSDKP